MSTRSWICLEREGDYECIYCHWNGYLYHNGRILLKHYQDVQKVKKLLSFGGMALLGERIMPDKDILHSYEMP